MIVWVCISAKYGEYGRALEVGSVELRDVMNVGTRALFHAKILDDNKLVNC